MTTTEPAVQLHDRAYIGGEWIALSGNETHEVINPATEQTIATVRLGTAADVDKAVSAAQAGFESWSRSSVSTRADVLAAIAAGLEARGDELAAVISQEVGTPIAVSRLLQAGLPAMTFSAAARFVSELPWEEELGNALIVREPVGVVGAITPWNYPLHQVAAKVAPALAAGCSIVVKPSEVAPLSSFIFAEIIDAVGLPAGVFNLVPGTGPVVGEALAGHPGIDMISLTGSATAGARVSELAARTIKKVALELGGKSANVILDDADLMTAVVDGVGKCFLNSGQTCTALTRMLVPRSRLAEVEVIAKAAVEAAVVGDPFDLATAVGPMVTAAHRNRVLGYIRRGIDEGATLVTGGTEPVEGLEHGWFVRPTVFSDVDPSMTIAQEEIFGPVLAILPYDDEDHAVAIANGTHYGLSGGVWSADPERAQRVARRLRTGQVEINGGAFSPIAPFGGYKQSGNGRELGPYGVLEFLETKAMFR
ncbi:MAG: aldehyde dehydrogenase [Nocardia sp.]|uniref:aldehyde dehydrogenase family protein n=1 Tax=Nocardia sp. TaxID=1821 RepID=UPI002601878F|nr:aldehyde dehydrogenase family protein [Nocardia sp.]MCU1644204.1 aldehyde dehydrogenase [Nocardia sp.]